MNDPSTATDAHPLVVENLVKEFSTGSGVLRVLDGASIQLEQGANLAVVGPSGSGKSTFLYIVGTLDQPTSGHVSLHGCNPFDLGESELATFRNEKIGFIFQDHHLLPQLSALENVLIPSIAARNPSTGSTQRAEHLLEQVGLADRRHHVPGQLSGGECQRVAVARALLNRPPLILADEPTGSLDRKNAELIGEHLLRLQQQENVMLICVTHNEQLADRFERKAHLDQGKFTSAS